MSIAERREVKTGEKLVEQGMRHHRLHLILSGKFSVKRDGDLTGEINENQFAGAMSFLTWEGNYEIRQAAQKFKEEEFSFWNNTGEGWESDSLFFSHFINSVTEFVMDIYYKKNQGHSNRSAGYDAETDSATPPNLDKATPPNPDKTIHVHGQHINQPKEQFLEQEKGYADVTCEEFGVNHSEYAIVYSWKFRELHKLLINEPRIGQCMDEFISKDLNRKMTANWTLSTRPRIKYKHMLQLALADNGEGSWEVTTKEKRALSTYQKKHPNHISDKDHLQFLGELEWTVYEYERGYKERHTRKAQVQ